MKKILCFILSAIIMLTPIAVTAETPNVTDLALNETVRIYNTTDSFLSHYYRFVVDKEAHFVIQFTNEIFEYIVFDKDNNPIYTDSYITKSYFELDVGEYIIEVTQYKGDNSFVVKCVDGVSGFYFNNDYIAVTSKDIIDIEYTVLPHEGLVDKIEYVIENTDVIDYDEDAGNFVAKSNGVTALTYNLTDIYGGSFTDTMYVVVAPNVKWNTNRPFAVPQKNDRVATVLEFKVAESGAYVIYSAGEGDPAAVLYDDEGEISGGDDELIRDFVINVNLEADKNYYLFVKNYAYGISNVYLVPDEGADESFKLDRGDVILSIGEEVLLFPNRRQDNLTATATPDELADITTCPDNVTIIGKNEGKGTITVNNGSESATVDITVTQPKELTPDIPESVTINKNYKNKRFSFTPDADGRYVISSIGDCDPYATLYNSNGTVIYSDDDSGEGYNFRICLDLKAGETYCLDTTSHLDATAKYKVVVSKAVPATEIKIAPRGYIGYVGNVYYYDDLVNFDFEVCFGAAYGAMEAEYTYSLECVTKDKEYILKVEAYNQELSDTIIIKQIESIFCDVNLDEKRTAEDYLLLKSRLDGTDDLVRFQLEKADVNSDFTVTQADLDIMLKVLEEIYGHETVLTAEGNVITAKCFIDTMECPVHNKGYTLTLTALGGEYKDAEYFATVEENLSDIIKGLSYTVYYEGINGTDYAATTSAPYEIGEYKAYVTIGEVTAVAEFKITKPTYTVGDINGNGKIDARDYLLLKRAYFGTYTLNCAPEAADINGNGKIDARDYLLLKRAYFGTYTIK